MAASVQAPALPSLSDMFVFLSGISKEIIGDVRWSSVCKKGMCSLRDDCPMVRGEEGEEEEVRSGTDEEGRKKEAEKKGKKERS